MTMSPALFLLLFLAANPSASAAEGIRDGQLHPPNELPRETHLESEALESMDPSSLEASTEGHTILQASTGGHSILQATTEGNNHSTSLWNKAEKSNTTSPEDDILYGQLRQSECNNSAHDPCETDQRNDLNCGFQSPYYKCDAHCIIYDDCSPGFSHVCPQVYKKALALKASHPSLTSVQCSPLLDALVIADCPISGNVSQTLLSKCREGSKINNGDFLPVRDLSSRLDFSNRYCALCNSVSEDKLHDWTVIGEVLPTALNLSDKGVDFTGVESVHFLFRHAFHNDAAGNEWVHWNFSPLGSDSRRCVTRDFPSTCGDTRVGLGRMEHVLFKVRITWRQSGSDQMLVAMRIIAGAQQVHWSIVVCGLESASLVSCEIQSCVLGRKLVGERCELDGDVVQDFAVWIQVPAPIIFAPLDASSRGPGREMAAPLVEVGALRLLQQTLKGTELCRSWERNGGALGGDRIATGDIMLEMTLRTLEVVRYSVNTSYTNVNVLHSYVITDVTPPWSARFLITFKSPSTESDFAECQMSINVGLAELLKEYSITLTEVRVCYRVDSNLEGKNDCREGYVLSRKSSRDAVDEAQNRDLPTSWSPGSEASALHPSSGSLATTLVALCWRVVASLA